MKIVVSGASGQFGGMAATMLLDRMAPEDLIVISRSPEKLKPFSERGAVVRYADFDKPESLVKAFAGADRLLLISTARVGTRVQQHNNATVAAVRAGVTHIVYTSIIAANESNNPAIVKLDHRATEEFIENSGADWTFLRDSQYAEAVAQAMVIPALMAGTKPDNCADGKVGFVARDDCVASAVSVLLGEGHEKKAYTLTGPEALSIPEAMRMAAELTGKPIIVEPVSDEGMFAYFDSLGVPRHASDIVPDGPIPWSSDDMVTFGQAIREGYFAAVTDHVERLTGQRPKTLRQVMIENKAHWPA